MSGEINKMVPDWFYTILDEWGFDYGRGKVVDLSARSSTQIVWADAKGRSFLSSAEERLRLNKSFAELRQLNFYAAEVLDLYYLCNAKSVRAIELKFKLSNRSAGQMLLAAEVGIFMVYNKINIAA
jgi:hypothetical protein